MSTFLAGIAAIAGTIGLYLLILPLYKKYKSPLLQPILVVSVLIILILLLFQIPYETYMIGGQWIELLMGPAVVALAIPLYTHYEVLKKFAIPVLAGVTAGAFTGVLTGLFFGKALGFQEELILALVPKSVTTPVAVSIAETLTGPASLAAVFVIAAGVSGVLMRPFIYKLFGLKTPAGRGVGIGSASHAMGTADSMTRNEEEGSFSTIAMGLSALIVSFIAPILVMVFL